MSLELRIPRRLESPNRSRWSHWRVHHRITKEWEKAIWAHAAIARGQGTAAAGLRKMRVVVERHVPSRRNFIKDDDNLTYAVKPLMDALKRQGYIKDDSRKWLEHPTPTQHVSVDGRDWTVIRIEAV